MTDSCRKHGISPAILSGWKYGGMDAEGVRLLGALERILDDGPSSWTFVLSKAETPQNKPIFRWRRAWALGC